MSKDQTDAARDQLDRILSFFPRVDGKVSWLFAMNAALLGIGSLNLHPSDLPIWFITLPAVATVLLVSISMFFLYRCSFPHLDGGSDSLVYFREIAARTEATYISKFLAASDEELANDFLGQVWRNSEILKVKFDAVKIAFILTASSLFPWCWFLVAVALVHTQVPAVH